MASNLLGHPVAVLRIRVCVQEKWMTSIFEELAAALSSKRVKRDRSTSVLCIRCIQNFHASREDFSLICAGKVEHLPHKCRLFCSARISVNKVRKTSVQFVFASLLFLPKKHNRFTTGCTHRLITQLLLTAELSSVGENLHTIQSEKQSSITKERNKEDLLLGKKIGPH